MEQLYKSLLEDGDLLFVLPAAKGNWEEDKKLFSQYYKELNEYIEDIEITDEEDIEDDYS